jgi:hypothetical protein
MVGRRVAQHQVDQHLEAQRVRGGHERVQVGQRAEARVDVAVVGDVVAEVAHRRRKEGRDPDRVGAELRDVGQAAAMPGRSPMPSPLLSWKLRG